MPRTPEPDKYKVRGLAEDAQAEIDAAIRVMTASLKSVDPVDYHMAMSDAVDSLMTAFKAINEIRTIAEINIKLSRANHDES